MFVNGRPWGNGFWYDTSCELCGKSFTVHGLMNAYSPYSHYCRECADKKVGNMIEEKIKQKKLSRAIKKSPCKSSIPIEKIKKAIKEVIVNAPLTHVYIVFVGGLKKEVIGVYKTREAANKRAERFKGCAKDTICHSLTEDVRVIKKRIIGVDNG